jgi:hypothetical protein
MRRIAVGLVLLAFGCAAPDEAIGPVGTTALLQTQSGSQVYIVVLQKDHPDPAGVAASIGAAPKHVYRRAIKGFAAELNSAAAAALQRNPNVVLIEPDGVASITDVQFPTPTWGLATR